MSHARLTTHVLDTAQGKPAESLRLQLYRINETHKLTLIVECLTNHDGRVDQPLLSNDSMKKGRYLLKFHCAEYFRRNQLALPDVPFLDVVPIEFGISDETVHYHVPLLLSPYGYSTYRGS